MLENVVFLFCNVAEGKKKIKKWRATIEVAGLFFLVFFVSERRGSLTPNRRKLTKKKSGMHD